MRGSIYVYFSSNIDDRSYFFQNSAQRSVTIISIIVTVCDVPLKINIKIFKIVNQWDNLTNTEYRH
jgi:hypothetical protein